MAPFDYDATQVRDSKSGYPTIPPGWYEFKIVEATEKTSKKGNNMVAVRCMVTEPFEYAGKTVFHNVTFLDPSAKGANMSIHFLKTIGEPHAGAFTVNSYNWRGKRFRAKVVEGEYEGNPRNEIKEVASIDSVKVGDDAIPF